MNRQIKVQRAHPTGTPWAAVPSKYMWELVEYLAYQRTHVHYTYGRSEFQVHFPCLDPPAAQEMLDRWAEGHGLAPPRDDITVSVPREPLMSSA